MCRASIVAEWPGKSDNEEPGRALEIGACPLPAQMKSTVKRTWRQRSRSTSAGRFSESFGKRKPRKWPPDGAPRLPPQRAMTTY